MTWLLKCTSHVCSVLQAVSRMSGSIQEEVDIPANHTGQGHKSVAVDMNC